MAKATELITPEMLKEESGRFLIPQNDQEEFTEDEIVDIIVSTRQLAESYPDFDFAFDDGDELAIIWTKIEAEHAWREVTFNFAGWIECRCGFNPQSQEDMDAHIPPVQ